MNRIGAWTGKIAIVASLIFSASAAHATVKLEGAWPDDDKTISIDASNLARSEAVRKIADAAGWSIVVHAPAGDPIDLHVKNQPAVKVLGLVLDDASYVAKRDGSLVSIERETETAPAPSASAPTAPIVDTSTIVAPPPPAASTPPISVSASTPEDRFSTGSSLRVEKDEVVKNVTVVGGSADVLGEVMGDLSVAGGSAHIRKGAHVHGAASTLGGSLDVEDGATIDGNVGVIGGVLTRAPGAKINGEIVKGKKPKHDMKIDLTDDDSGSPSDDAPGFSIHRTTSSIGSALMSSALQFVFGAILLALATDRMERLRSEIAARPMRSFALGLVGAIATALTLVVLCVTLIGIPIALGAAIFGAFGFWAGFAAVLATTGQALFGHRTKNPYTHLALGCLLLLVLGHIPMIGPWVRAFVAFVGFGALIATRGAGIISGRSRATI